MFKSRKAGRDEAWEGTVVDKSRGLLDGSNMYHFVKVRRSDGESVEVRISRGLWKAIAIGDRIVKQPGSDPVKG
ncbi:hypothetical protein ACIREE_41955 [Streptomyces sp. NPDC102467]|uniref:DUF7489 domain-containing protein n=1 Tax=Streptomyces sp. NPDC102467 TaxID=3366179 RepID=UPI003801C59E